MKSQKIYCKYACRPKPKQTKFTLNWEWFINNFYIKKGQVCSDTEKVVRWLHENGRVRLKINNKYYYEDRLVWFYHTKALPKYKVIHIDGDLENSEFANLKEVTRYVKQKLTC
jgi:hypothetical protein